MYREFTYNNKPRKVWVLEDNSDYYLTIDLSEFDDEFIDYAVDAMLEATIGFEPEETLEDVIQSYGLTHNIKRFNKDKIENEQE